MTERLLKKAKIVIKTMHLISNEFTVLHEQRLLQRIRSLICKINIELPMFKKQAPICAWAEAKKISEALWRDISVTSGSNVSMIRKRKAAATAIILASKTGARWIDVHRLRWEDLVFSKVDNTKFIQAKLRLSKNNIINDFPQSLTWASTTNTPPRDCPRAILKRWWKWCGCPEKGYIFSTVDKK